MIVDLPHRCLRGQPRQKRSTTPPQNRKNNLKQKVIIIRKIPFNLYTHCVVSYLVSQQQRPQKAISQLAALSTLEAVSLIKYQQFPCKNTPSALYYDRSYALPRFMSPRGGLRPPKQYPPSGGWLRCLRRLAMT